MKHTFLLLSAVLLVLLLAGAGCTENKPVAATPVPTTQTPEATPPTTAVTSPPEPVVTLPENQKVSLELTKDRVYSEIHLLYNGGGGELFTQKVEMKVTRSDGQVNDYIMSNGNRPKRGDEIVATGTRGSDRCEIWVTSGGVRYKVIDQSLIIGGAYQGN